MSNLNELMKEILRLSKATEELKKAADKLAESTSQLSDRKDILNQEKRMKNLDLRVVRFQMIKQREKIVAAKRSEVKKNNPSLSTVQVEQITKKYFELQNGQRSKKN